MSHYTEIIIFMLILDDQENIMAHIKSLFAQLQLSKESTVNPSDLIKLLELSNNEQQDAPEFHNLFLGLVENRLNVMSSDVIVQQFQGKCIYLKK